MLGESFLATGYELTKATRFDQVSRLYMEDLKRLIGASEMILFEYANDLSFIRVIGDGRASDWFRANEDAMRLWLETNWLNAPHTCELVACPFIDGEPQHKPEVAGWLKDVGCSDLLGGTLFRGMFRSVCFGAVRYEGHFDKSERERMEVAILISSGVCSSLTNHGFERQMLVRLKSKRTEANNALFVVRDGQVQPYNPCAVSYAEMFWGRDDVELTLPDEARKRLESAIMAAWSSPVDAQWASVELDLGGGAQEIAAIARIDSGIMLYFAPLTRSTTANAVPMLTKRQCDIMDWIAEGKTSSEVAIILEISPRTVEKHLEAIFQRFGVENRVAAVRSYLEAKGELSPGPVPT
jgi:DNA-binding CsgD family transcriptional regulator